MSRPPSFVIRLTRCLATTLAVACSGPTEPPPAEATLAFTMDSSIYIVSTEEGATPSLLVPDFIQPSWSADGGTLAMVGTTDFRPGSGFPPSQALYLADADGGNVRQLTGFDYLIRPPILWSPDGTSLLFLRSREYNPSYRFVVRVAAGGGPVSEIGPRGFVDHPSWSHDGSLIALNQSPISVINAADGTVVLALRGTSARFSPVRDEFAFNAWPLDSAQHIHLIRPDSTADRDLQASGSPTSWSPDGNWLAFEKAGIRSAAGFFIVQTWVIRPDGSGLTRIGPGDADVSELAWSADGQRIAYIVRTSLSGPRHIEIARPDGSGARSLVTSGAVCCLSWRPQGSN